jgi:hypothetical protein
MCPQAGRLAEPLALKTDHAAEYCGRQQAYYYLDQMF